LPLSARLKLERVSLIERLVGAGESLTSACRLVGVPRATYYRWRAHLKAGVMALVDGRAGNRRRRCAPAQEAVRPLIKQYRLDNPVGKDKLAVVMARDGVMVSASTLQRVLHAAFERGELQRLGYASRATGCRRRAARRAHAQRKASGVRPLRPGELVQIDTLHERSILTRPRNQFTAVDPITKQLHAQLYSRPTSRNAAAFLGELVAALPIRLNSVQVDNGSEFMGEFEAACAARGIASFTPSRRLRLRRTGWWSERSVLVEKSITLSNRRHSPWRRNGRR